MLIQHLLSIAIGEGFQCEAMYKEIKGVPCCKNLTKKEYRKILTYLEKGGEALDAYPEYHKIICEDGWYKVIDTKIAR